MINFVTGNFFEHNADIRINTVNCVGVMGAGVALQFKNKYPEMYKEYLKACNDNSIKIGKPHVWSNNTFFNDGDNDNSIIINFPTKMHWKNPSEYEYIEKGLEWLSKFLLNHESKTITVPALGCGHGGLDWNIVKKMIVESLSNINMNILVFEPESSIQNNNSLDIENTLREKNIIKISPTSINYPDRLKGNSSSEIYINGSPTFFNKPVLSIFVNSDVDEKEKKVIFECLENQDLLKFNFLLGFNNSFEIDIVKFLLSKNIPVAITLPYGILNLKIRKDLLDVWNNDLVTVISISNPTNKWSIGESVKILKFRFKISNILLFTYHDLKSILNYENDIIETNSSRFYINYWTEPISFYKRIHAKKIGKSKETNKPNLQPILELL